MKTKKISFPHMGNYYISFRPIVELFGCEVIVPPPITKKTLELGAKNSPEAVCIPFKYNLGNYIESLDNGANILIQSAGGCRFGFYGEVQNEILKKMGYSFEFVQTLSNFNIKKIFNDFKKINPELTNAKITKGFIIAFNKMLVLDKIDTIIRENIGFESEKGSFEKLNKIFLKKLDAAKKLREINSIKRKYSKLIKEVKIDKPKNPLRVAIVGELYILMEPFSNYNIEKELGKRGVEVKRFLDLTSLLHEYLFGMKHINKILKYSNPYLKYHIGAHGTASVGMTHKLIHDGYDGVIHIKPFGCMPEVNAMSILHKISRDHKFPIMYFSFDSQTSETGIKTRLEAFYDMLKMRRDKNEKN